MVVDASLDLKWIEKLDSGRQHPDKYICIYNLKELSINSPLVYKIIWKKLKSKTNKQNNNNNEVYICFHFNSI